VQGQTSIIAGRFDSGGVPFDQKLQHLERCIVVARRVQGKFSIIIGSFESSGVPFDQKLHHLQRCLLVACKVQGQPSISVDVVNRQWMGVVGEFNHVACCLAKTKPGQRESIASFRMVFERILLETGLWVFLDYLSNGIIFQFSQRNKIIMIAAAVVEDAEKFVTRRLSEYDDRLVFVRGLNTTAFPILEVKRRGTLVE
jgi:hypothetical protein